MRLFRPGASLLIALVCTASSIADAPDPLRLIPHRADLCVRVGRPGDLLASIRNNEIVKQLQTIEAVREFYGSTNYQRYSQLVAYFEKELGAKLPEIITRLTGGGAAYGIEFTAKPPQLLIVQGTDEQMLRRFVQLALQVADEELARRESKEVIKRARYHDFDTVHLGDGFHAAVAGAAIVVSNSQEQLHKSLDLLGAAGGKSLAPRPEVAQARSLVGREATVWMWMNLEKAHAFPGTKELFRLPRDNGALTAIAGGILDIAGRSAFLCAGLRAGDNGFALSLQMPHGLKGMPAPLAATLPPAKDTAVPPLLEPPGVLYSAAIYMDFAKFWELRTKLFNDKQVKNLEQADKQTAVYLAGSPVSKILGQAGAHHRIVVTHRSKPSYRVNPGQHLPSFAFVFEQRDVEGFSKRMEANLRAAALLASTQVKLKPVEEKHGDVRIVGYRFPEDGQFPLDAENIRFNFTPCFATVRKQFILSSSMDLCHDLITILDKETPTSEVRAVPFRQRFYAEGGAQVLEYYRDRLFTQTILDQAIPPEQAQEQVRAFIDIVRRLGAFEVADSYYDNSFRLDFRLQLHPNAASKEKTVVAP
jgi:hypothetical protein